MKKLLNAVLGLTLGAAVSAPAKDIEPPTTSLSEEAAVIDTRFNMIIYSFDAAKIDTLTKPGILFILK